MKKMMTLAEQVRDAQKTMSGWSTQKRESVRLEGTDFLRTRVIDNRSYTEKLIPQKKG
jgi:hypothetical protein